MSIDKCENCGQLAELSYSANVGFLCPDCMSSEHFALGLSQGKSLHVYFVVGCRYPDGTITLFDHVSSDFNLQLERARAARADNPDLDYAVWMVSPVAK